MRRSLLECQWVLPKAAPEKLRELFSHELCISPYSASLLYNRGLRSIEQASRFLNISLAHMHSPFLFKHMECAVERIVRALTSDEKIVIYGDYDVDGVTGVSILLMFLRHCGANPIYYIPHRLREGYGLNPAAIPRFGEQGATLLITVDCGSADEEAVRVARQCGIDVIVTDHHECSGSISGAVAVLNPKGSDSGFPFTHLAGVGVAFNLLVALRARLRELGYWVHRKEPNLLRYLDLVALGTVADTMPLQEDNRIFAKFGMDEIAANKRPGILALKERAGVLDRPVDTRTILFRLGPRINAAGRLGFAEESVELFTCEDLTIARELALVLEERNRERREIEESVYQEARQLAEIQIQEQDRNVLVLASENWHGGILGTVASRIANEFCRPAVIIALDNAMGKGSVRGVGDILLMDALESSRACLEGFGGHQGAAGIRIRIEHIDLFRNAFENAVKQQMGTKSAFSPSLHLDIVFESPRELTESLVKELEMFAPFGHGNDEPVVALNDMCILDSRVVGENHLKLQVERDSVRFDAIGFGMSSLGDVLTHHNRWDLACTPYLDTWNGNRQIQLRLLDIRPS